MSILSGAIGTMKKKSVVANSEIQGYQVYGTFNSKTYWVTGATQETTKQWKTTNTSTAGTGSLTDGLTNSNNMNNSSHPAAFYCRGLTLGGYTWFLPAKDELHHINMNMIISGILTPTGSHVDKFTAIAYWSSSELSGAYAWCQHMATGAKIYVSKTGSYRVRACRAV